MILGIDSSDDYLSVGLSSEGRIIFSRSSLPQAQGKTMLHTFILSVLSQAGHKISDLEGVAVAIGPGSFTGLRVGLAAAKGICWATKLPLAGVSSLMAIAHCANIAAKEVVAVKDARREEFYFGGFTRLDRGYGQIIPDSIGSAGDIFALADKGYALIGPGIEALAKNPGCPTISDGGYDREGIGGAVALLGEERLKAGKVLDLANSIPNYIRVPRPREWKP
ncbi:MAG: tRNA (adenosine(37)-N6)-threonylcarbamoyltransferase complex dimerization subunit type 1 TsaB [candidate division Zixibacteria bacterium RBG_16_53_22]|nr:MAG: tRNA (adenosine(37)-N6)-threonylcarbamoyltransferase complex dimerization subunit type 1 TsaB [candidate division Zixibacteria bacterium RBG_16_53_22]